MTQISMFTRPGAKANSAIGQELLIDNFAGGGGASTGIELAFGRSVDIAINHDRSALEMHAANHPHTRHLCEDVWDVNPAELCAGRRVGLAWFSPDCKHFSRAKGAKPVNKRIRGLAWIAVKWAKAVRPRVIFLENVREFREWGPLGEDNRPCPRRKGNTFRRFIAMLQNLGYAVDHRVLNAADYGAPTHRRRLFLVARCDGLPILWPEPTHGPGRGIPYRSAAECIDWSLPCPSIFERKKPLAEKTLRRIAMGLKRYVLENASPFIVNVQHGGDHFRGQNLNKPLSTITKSHGYGLVAPCLARMNHGQKQWNDVHDPLTTVTSQGNKHALVSAMLTRYNSQKGTESRCHDPAEPLRTLDTQNRFGVVAAFLNKYRADSPGTHPADPLPTITSGCGAKRAAGAAHALGLSVAHLTKFYGTNVGSDPDSPMPTVTASGQHLGEVRAFLIKYFGTAIGQEVRDPLHTVTAKDRFGLVTVNGQEYAIADIGLRMLTPRELLRAQFSPELAEHYILPRTAAQAVAKIGNSVAPLVAAALVKANMAQDAILKATA